LPRLIGKIRLERLTLTFHASK